MISALNSFNPYNCSVANSCKTNKFDSPVSFGNLNAENKTNSQNPSFKAFNYIRLFGIIGFITFGVLAVCDTNDLGWPAEVVGAWACGILTTHK